MLYELYLLTNATYNQLIADMLCLGALSGDVYLTIWPPTFFHFHCMDNRNKRIENCCPWSQNRGQGHVEHWPVIDYYRSVYCCLWQCTWDQLSSPDFFQPYRQELNCYLNWHGVSSVWQTVPFILITVQFLIFLNFLQYSMCLQLNRHNWAASWQNEQNAPSEETLSP